MDNENNNIELDWWNDPKSKETLSIPVSIIESDGEYIISFNDETTKLLGSEINTIASGDTKSEAISNFFMLLRSISHYNADKQFSYERFVPFIHGDWSHIGGTWFIIFGIHFYFRYGEGMIGGWYLPFTKLNISVYSLWRSYKRWKEAHKEE